MGKRAETKKYNNVFAASVTLTFPLFTYTSLGAQALVSSHQYIFIVQFHVCLCVF